MKKALAIGLAAAMAVTMTAPVYASDDSESGKGIAKEDLKIGAIYIGDENEGYTAAHMAGIDEMQEALGLDDSQVQFSAKTKNEAITKACIELGVSSDQLDIQVVSEGSSGFFGIGSKPAIIKARKVYDNSEEKEIETTCSAAHVRLSSCLVNLEAGALHTGQTSGAASPS